MSELLNNIIVLVMSLQIGGLIVSTYTSIAAEFYIADEEKEVLTFRDKALQKGRDFYLKIADFFGISFVVVTILVALTDKY